ncbi:MAG: Ca-activated chloride channel family protein [Sphingobacteriales bacterium]|jgi:Ca-activated chloride channel family protein
MPNWRILFLWIPVVFFIACEEPERVTTNIDLDLHSSKYQHFDENPFVESKNEHRNAFSLEARGFSFPNMELYINEQYNIPKRKLRLEGMMNYFDMNLPLVGSNAAEVFHQIAPCPWEENNKLLMVAVKGGQFNLSQLPEKNISFLIDVSGSMDAPDKLALIKEGMLSYAQTMRSFDRISIVLFGGKNEVYLPPTRGASLQTIVEAINNLRTYIEGNPGNSLELAYTQLDQFAVENSLNHVVLFTDGKPDFFDGTTSSLINMVGSKANSRKHLSIFGVGSNGSLDENDLEKLALLGQGQFNYIFNVNQFKRIFIDEIGFLYPVIQNAKPTVYFNDNLVKAYRLLGFEERFSEDQPYSRAASLGGNLGINQTAVALYELRMDPNPDDDRYGEVILDFQNAVTGAQEKYAVDLRNEVFELANAEEDLRFFAGISAFCLWLKDSPYRGKASREMAEGLCFNALNYDPLNRRQRFVQLMKDFVPE